MKDVKIKTFPPAVMTVEMTRKGVDAGILWEPLVAKALETGELRVMVDPGKIYVDKFKKRFFHGATGTIKKFFDDNRSAVRAYNDAINEAVQYTLNNKVEANKITASKWKQYTADQVGAIRDSWGDGWITSDIDREQIVEMQFMYDKMVELTDYFKTKPIASEFMINP